MIKQTRPILRTVCLLTFYVQVHANYLNDSSFSLMFSCLYRAPFLIYWDAPSFARSMFSGVSFLMTLAGTPATKTAGSIIFPSGTSAHAAIREPSPITAPFKIVAPIPINAPPSTVQPCRTTLCPTVTFSPTLIGKPGST